MTSLSRRGVTVAAAITGAVIVAIAGCSATRSPASLPTGTSTGTSTPTSNASTSTSTSTSTPASTSTSGPAGTCTKALPGPKGECGPYTNPQVMVGTTGDVTVGNDVWSPPETSWSQTIHVTNAGNWNVVANFPAGETSVHSFPNTGQTQDWIDGTDLPAALSSWSSMVSSYSVNLNAHSGTVAEAAYDLWLDDWNNEVMIQTDFAGDSLRPRCDVDKDVIATQTFGGTNGVPVQRWNLCQFGSELIWQPSTGTNYPSDRVNVMAMLTWLENHGNGKYLSANPTLTAVSFGFEICSTGGRNQTMQVNSFSFVATPAKLSGTGRGDSPPGVRSFMRVSHGLPGRVCRLPRRAGRRAA